MNDLVNKQVILARRPDGVPKPDDFVVTDAPRPRIAPGQILLQNLYLSLDPYMRGRMNDGRGSYAAPYPLGTPLGGGTVSKVVESRLDGFGAGDLVVADGGWQTFALSDGAGLRRLPRDMAHPSLALGALGMTGFTAWHGLTAIGQPKRGEVLVVGAAAGAVGSVVGQIGRLLGCRVVGIAGGAAKCRHVVEDLGFDACVDHRAPDLASRIARDVPNGIDIYFENVGGAVFEAVRPLLNIGARVPVCGLVSGYNGAPASSASVHDLLMTLVLKRIRMQGFMSGDLHESAFEGFVREMDGWLSAGLIKADETIVDGLENAPDAFIGLFNGRNLGKTVVSLELIPCDVTPVSHPGRTGVGG